LSRRIHTLTSVTIFASVASFGGNTFFGCTRLASITISNSYIACAASS